MAKKLNTVTKVRDLNIEEAVRLELIEEQKTAIVSSVKQLQMAISKSKSVTEQLETNLEALLDMDIDELVSDPYWEDRLPCRIGCLVP